MATSHGTVEADGIGTVRPVAARLNGKYQDTVRAAGISHVAIHGYGKLTQSARAAASSTVRVGVRPRYAGRVHVANTSTVFVAYAPTIGDSEPIGIGLSFRAVAEVTPPQLDADVR